MHETTTRQRAPRSDRGKTRGPRPGSKVRIELMLRPDHIAWARRRVESGDHPSVSEYVDWLIAQHQITSHVV